MRRTLFASSLTIALLAAPSLALAHAGHDAAASLASAFAHPFSGLDHLLVMTVVGLAAGMAGGRMLWALPLGFLTAMASGMLAAGMPLAGVELAITASAVVLLVMLFARRLVSPAVLMAAVAIAGPLHGQAHGMELFGSGAAVSTVIGALAGAATIMLVGMGLAWAGTKSRAIGAHR